MSNIIIKKWMEPYILLETFKKHFEMEDLTFDGLTKQTAKDKMLKIIEKNEGKAFGLYMKNVNKFYIFKSADKQNTDNLLGFLNLSLEDAEITEDYEIPLQYVDLAKAEAAIIL